MATDAAIGQTGGAIDAFLQEERRYPPSPEFVAQANWNDPAIYERAEADPEAFWAEQAKNIDWFAPWDKVLDWNVPWAKWFVGAKVNASYNCVDRHLSSWRRNKAAIIFEGEPGDQQVLTYRDLYREVNRAAAALQRLGVKQGDRVAIYMGMVPELAIALLACARIGAPHTVIFGGFSADSIADRINDCQATVAITADGGWRRGARVPLKDNMDRALENCPSIKKVLVVNRTDDAARVPMRDGRDVWWHAALAESGSTIVPPAELDSEHPLYILYTSGTTGKPKGMLHTTGGYLVGTSTTHRAVFDLKEEDVYWCTADIGWVTGHSYIVYGPLANGATCVMYEGAPDYPDKDRFWSIIEKYAVTILYTAPTAIRTFMRWGTEYLKRHDLSSLRMLGSVGEPINPEAWVWYREHVGGDRCPVVDTWWMTETGQILITPLPGITALKPGSATFPFPSIKADVLNEQGQSVPLGSGGYLVLQRPWPAMARTIWGDPERYEKQYWSRFPGIVLRRRRRQARRRGLLLAARPCGRRAQRRWPPHRHDGGRVGAGQPPGRGRGGRDRRHPRDQGPGHRRLRHAAQRLRAEPGHERGAPQPRRREDRPDRQAGPHLLHLRAAEDAQRQDHAAPPARHCRGQGAGRYDHARRPDRAGVDQGAVRGKRGLILTSEEGSESPVTRYRGRTRRPTAGC